MPFTTPRPARPYLALPDGWDTAWRAAKEASGVTPAWVAVLGDSIAQGFNADDTAADGWFGKLRSGLSARYPTIYGDWYGVGESVAAASAFAGTPPWVLSTGGDAGTLQVGNAGLDRNATWSGVGAGPVAAFTSPYVATQLDVILSKWFAAAGTVTFTVSLAGGDIVPTVSPTIAGFGINSHSYSAGGDLLTVVVDVPATNAAMPLLRVALTGLTSAAHVVTFTAQSADNILGLQGICLYKASTGIGYAKLASTGQETPHWIAASLTSVAKPTNRPMLMQGYTTTSQNTVGFGFPTQPSLCILAYGLNDCSNANGPEMVARTLDRWAMALRRGADNCSLLFVANSNPDGVSSDVTSGLLTNSKFWHLYLREIELAAARWNGAFLNVHTLYGQRSAAAGYQLSTNMHPVNAGHTLIANTILGVI